MGRRFWLGAALLLGCSAPHDNPFDPDSPFAYGWVTVHVRDLLGRPAEGIEIRCASQVQMTDSRGEARFGPLHPGLWSLRVGGQKAPPESLDLVLSPGETLQVSRTVNLYPVAESLQIRSLHFFQERDPPELFYLELAAWVRDPEEQVTEVWVRVGTDSLELGYTREGWFFLRVSEDALAEPLAALVGMSFRLFARDPLGPEVEVAQGHLWRVLSFPPVPRSPIGGLSVVPPFDLIWSDSLRPFPYTYTVFVHAGPTGDTVLVASGLTDTLWTVVSLPPGLYYWTVAAVDSWGNMVRSVEAPFVVEQGHALGREEAGDADRDRKETAGPAGARGRPG